MQAEPTEGRWGGGCRATADPALPVPAAGREESISSSSLLKGNCTVLEQRWNNSSTRSLFNL